MKKIIIILAALVVIFGAIGFYIVSSVAPKVPEFDQETIEVGDQTYYEPDYAEGNSADKIGGLNYTLPNGFTPINSDIDAIVENNFINTSTGVQLSITQEKGKSSSYLNNLSNEYLDGAEDVEKFNVGDYTCYKYTYKQDGEVIECDFHMIAGSSMYSGQMFHPEEVANIQEDEPDPITLTEEEIAQFNGLCKSLSFK